MPSAFQATVLPRTSAPPELLTTIPPPQPQLVNAQPFSHTALPVIEAPVLISNRIPWWVLSWTRLPLTVNAPQLDVAPDAGPCWRPPRCRSR